MNFFPLSGGAAKGGRGLNLRPVCVANYPGTWSPLLLANFRTLLGKIGRVPHQQSIEILDGSGYKNLHWTFGIQRVCALRFI